MDKPLPLEAVKGIVLESIGARTSGYETSDERVNRLFNNIIWGQRGNFLSFRQIARNGMSVWAGQGMRRYLPVRLLII